MTTLTLNKGHQVEYDQNRAFENADFVYAKNWSSYCDYGKILNTDSDWMITQEKLGTAKFMHCLPVRRNVVVEDAVLDSENSIVIPQVSIIGTCSVQSELRMQDEADWAGIVTDHSLTLETVLLTMPCPSQSLQGVKEGVRKKLG